MERSSTRACSQKKERLDMKITITLKTATKTSICRGLLKAFNNITDIKVFGKVITCIIPNEPVAPG